MNSLFITYENDEWRHLVVHNDFPALTSFCCVCFVSFCSFLFFLSFFVSSITCRGIEISRGVVPRFLSGVSRDKLLQPDLVINVTGLVQLGKNLNHILPPLASQDYLLESNFVKLIHQFFILFMVTYSLELLEKSSKKKKKE